MNSEEVLKTPYDCGEDIFYVQGDDYYNMFTTLRFFPLPLPFKEVHKHYTKTFVT